MQQGLVPEFDYIYVPCGSQGTAAGLLLGVKAAGLKTTIIPVCIRPMTYAQDVTKLSRKTNELLWKADPTFPYCNIQPAICPSYINVPAMIMGCLPRKG